MQVVDKVAYYLHQAGVRLVLIAVNDMEPYWPVRSNDDSR